MTMERFFINYKGKKISVEVKRQGFFGRFSGLMFKSSKTENLLFEFDELSKIPIHSFFVFFPFLAVWIDDKNKIIEKRLVYPWKFSIAPKKSFKVLVEIPVNSKNKKIIDILV
jgi:uncharacterized membrane protein (UPF0127 family)